MMTTTSGSPRFDVHRLVRLSRVSSIRPAPDGTWAAVAVQRLDADGARYISDLWRVSLVDPHAEPVQLTRGPSSDSSPWFRRDGALAFLSNRNPRDGEPDPGDDQRNQVWLMPAGGGEPRPITDEPLGVDGFRFASGGDRLIVVAPVLPGVAHDEQRKTALDRAKHGPSALRYTRAPVRMWDHWIAEAAPHLIAYDETGGGRRDLTPDADREHREHWFEVQWDISPDGTHVVVTHAEVGADRLDDMALRLIETATGASSVFGGEPSLQLAAPVFSPDGKRIACQHHIRSKQSAGTDEVWIYDVATGDGRGLKLDGELQLTLGAWTPDGNAIVAAGAHRGCEPVFRVEAQSGEVTRITSDASGGCHLDLHVVGGAVVGIRHALLHPPEVFRAPLAAGAEPALLTSMSGFTPEDGAVIARWEAFSVTADDGVEVPSFALFPADHGDGDAPLPGMMWIHGGPVSHNCDGWHWRWNALIPVAQGYALTLPNPAGSTGYGQAFIDRVWRNRWGAECYTDLMKVADWMEQHPAIDANRIGAMGGSFGGYMANWIGGQTDRFKVLVTHASLFALSQFHGPTDVPPWLLLELGCSPYDDLETFDRYSPHRFVKNWKTPTLVIHGEKDYRVPIGEGLTLFEALQMHGVESELLVYPDENHWVLKPRNVAVWYETWQEFVGRYLR
jgi:dipeptidyl aminopeptidase/acylaminoacyl peptidase